MKVIRTGCTRIVVLLGSYAIKVPITTDGWRAFLKGLLANMQEVSFARTGWPELCPVLFSLPGGWLLVMPRVREMTDEEFHSLDYGEWIKAGRDLKAGEWVVPVEAKSNSFGFFEGHIVAIDYGN